MLKKIFFIFDSIFWLSKMQKSELGYSVEINGQELTCKKKRAEKPYFFPLGGPRNITCMITLNECKQQLGIFNINANSV